MIDSTVTKLEKSVDNQLSLALTEQLLLHCIYSEQFHLPAAFKTSFQLEKSSHTMHKTWVEQSETRWDVRAAHMARDDLEWEIEQLRQQNSQLRKDNRELKMDYMRLESRIEVLENKFRTMARLLQ
uniref:Uncharacterized protein n=1 Tax=Parascaris equorum TaxID=6256 RepID=A0A914R1N9_PAREQ